MENIKHEFFDALGKIFAIAKEKGWSTYKLSELSGVSQSTISGWSSGRNLVSFSSLEKIVCVAFNMSLPEFFMTEETDIDVQIEIISRELKVEMKKQLLIYAKFLEHMQKNETL